MKKIGKLFKVLFFGLVVGLGSISMTSCATTEKSATSFNFQNVSCSYDSGTDETYIVWSSTLENKSIYNIKNCSFKFDLYDGTTFLRTTEWLNYKISVKHCSSKTNNCYFYAEGKVTKIEFNAWTATFTNLWNTYRPWFISTIIAAPVLAVILFVAMLVSDSDLDDVWEFFVDHFYFVFIVLIPFVPYIILGLSESSWSWVPPVIIGGGILAFVAITGLLLLIPWLIEVISDCTCDCGCGYEPSDRSEMVADCIDSREELSQFTVAQLKEYCRDYDIPGYSTLGKAQLIDLILDENESDEEASEDKEKDNNSNKKAAKQKNISKISFDDIAGLDEVKKAFKEKVIMPFEHPELFAKFGKKAGGGILLYGLPGTGKTMFAEAAANEIDALFIPIKCSDVKSKWYGESEQKVKDIFRKARRAEKAIIFFDEFEAIGAKRTDSENGNNDLVPQILAEMQGVGTSSNKSTIVVIAATNKPWAIDSAFMRPGRFDEKIYVPLPDFDARKKLFELQLKKLPIADDLDFDYLAKITDGLNGADIKEVCEKLKMSAINDSLAKGEEQTIGMDDVERIETSIKSSVSREDIERLEEFEEGLSK